MNTEMIQQALQREGGLKILDKLIIPQPWDNTVPALRICLGAEWFLSAHTDKLQRREQLIQFLLDYAKTFPEQIDCFMAHDSTRPKKFHGDLEARIRQDSAKYPIGERYSAEVSSSMDIHETKNGFPVYNGYAITNNYDKNRISHSGAYCTVYNGDTCNDETLKAGVIRWATMMQPLHGSAGFYLLPWSVEDSENGVPLLQRFPGLEMQTAIDFVLEAEAEHEKLRSINWLTILCDHMVNMLGGKANMQAALEPMCKIHSYPGGVVIQAGASPQLGDTWEGHTLEAYKMVSDYTKAVRFEAYHDGGLFYLPDQQQDREETLRWVRRFDD